MEGVIAVFASLNLEVLNLYRICPYDHIALKLLNISWGGGDNETRYTQSSSLNICLLITILECYNDNVPLYTILKRIYSS